MFEAVNPKADIQKVEHSVLDFWRENRVFQQSMERREGAPKWVTYEGPPTVNGNPGVHHVLARAFKDMFPRFKTMRGHYVLRKGGWDTHGLPVEIAMEKELGLKQKKDIEAFGIAKFNELCRESVLRNIGIWTKFTERMAYWTDLENPYTTLENSYIESVWWVLKQLFEQGLIYKGFKTVPFCTRCGTPLSSHELSLGYEDVKDPSVYVRFAMKDQPGVSFLVWTTTPWTLPGNAALAVGEKIQYVQVEGPAADGGTEQLILAEARLSALKNAEAYTVVKRMTGSELLGMRYIPLYNYIPVEQDAWYVLAGNFVSTEDGTGIVHIAPAFGADDLRVGQQYGLPLIRTVTSTGHFVDAVTPFAGMWFKEADPEVITDLKRRGLMYRSEKYEHSYPHCWRDGTPLMYVARDSWYIRTTDRREKMVELNKTINWVPSHVREGRFGNWLDELKDWALGRERYWGTPLPIWIDDKTGEMLCVGSVAELSRLAGRDLSELDLHRPHVDDIAFPNPNGKGGTMRRVPEVIDVWFDSGAMPVAQWGYPATNQQMFEEQFPADYICEAVDQTRGWFYTLHSIASMTFDSVAFKNVICLGHILDGEGQKMSKSKGNVIDPWDVMNAHGSDAMRWYLYTSGPPGEPRRFSVDLVGEVARRFWGTLWNTYSFFVTYANIAGWTPEKGAPAVADRDPLDKWLLASVHKLVKDVTEAYDEYDVTGATRPVQAFIEDLSNWYVRLSRRRFWDGDPAAMATLYEALVLLSKLLAPATPMIAEHLYRELVAKADPSQPSSVHWTDWPSFDAALIDKVALDDMEVVQKLVSLGRAARDTVEIGVRQPLASAAFVTRSKAEAEAVRKLSSLIEGELNVKAIRTLDGADDVVEYKLNPLPQVLGKKFGKDFPKVQKTLREGDAEQVREWAQALKRGDQVKLTLGGAEFSVTNEEVEVKQGAAQGYAVAEDGGLLAAVDTRLTDELVAEGLAREVVRRVQDTRRKADFNVEDRIHLVYTATGALADAIRQFASYIQEETLAVSLEQGEASNGYYRADFLPDADPKKDGSVRDESLTIGVKRA
jgi:isoleucyl-tRNA synthetase